MCIDNDEGEESFSSNEADYAILKHVNTQIPPPRVNALGGRSAFLKE